jgi:uncharacterized protein (TIGR03435 family)
LLRQYAENHSDAAFTALVERHLNLVYSVALRQTGDPHDAQEIAQAVFIILARKAGSLRHDKALSSWLFQTTRLAANNFIRSGIRRLRREQEAYMQSLLNEPTDDNWRRIAPMLDAAVGALAEKDRRAILLRFYEGRNLQEIGAVLGASEDAAEKRVSRALEKLRKIFLKRGVDSTTAAIAGTMSVNFIQAAPEGLGATISAVALAKGAAASTSTLTLMKGALKIMAWTKAKSAIAACAVVLIVAGTTPVVVKEYDDHRTYAWELPPFPDTSKDEPAAERELSALSPQVRILPSRYSKEMFAFGGGGPITYVTADGITTNGNDPWRFIGVGYTLDDIIRTAYDTNHWYPWTWRTVYLAKIPSKPRYDFISNLPGTLHQPLQELIKKKFGLAAKWELRNADVLALRLANPDAPAFRPAGSLLRQSDITNTDQQMFYNSGWLERTVTAPNGSILGEFQFNCTIDYLLEHLSLEQMVFHLPIVNETGLTNRYDVTFSYPQWSPRTDPNSDEWKNEWKDALSKQLGLQLVPTNMPVEMLVIENAE